VAFWVVLPLSLWVAASALDQRFRWARAPWSGGAPALVAGLALVAWGATALWYHGGGLPVSALPPPRFTRRGAYRHVRHPIYLGYNIAIFGAGLLLGSRALAWVVAPLFAPLWVGYARVEERFLLRRFGCAYRRYERQVGLLPRLGLYRLAQFLQLFNVLRAEVAGRERIPRRGPAVLVFNHASYLDPGYVGAVTARRIHFMTTAEAYRSSITAFLVKRFCNVPVRRYRQDVSACREMLRLLAEGELIGIAVEGERTWLGEYQGALPDVAVIVARLAVPVVPVGVSGAYDAGPRWSDLVRLRPVRVRVGHPIAFAGRDPVSAIDEALRALLDEEPQRLHFVGLPREKLERVLWRCPACDAERGWRPAELSCAGCGAVYTPTSDSRLRDRAGNATDLAELGRRVRAVVDEALEVPARVWKERSIHGPIEPLLLVGQGSVRLAPDGLRFAGLHLPLDRITRVSTERADTLQVATRKEMWQFRLASGSAYRLHIALERWRAAGRAARATPTLAMPG
jgi:1-acyl-sn-glycerol-3-phosphate acyltransferase